MISVGWDERRLVGGTACLQGISRAICAVGVAVVADVPAQHAIGLKEGRRLADSLQDASWLHNLGFRDEEGERK